MRPAKVVETNQNCQAHTASEDPVFKKQLRQHANQVEVIQLGQVGGLCPLKCTKIRWGYIISIDFSTHKS